MYQVRGLHPIRHWRERVKKTIVHLLFASILSNDREVLCILCKNQVLDISTSLRRAHEYFQLLGFRRAVRLKIDGIIGFGTEPVRKKALFLRFQWGHGHTNDGDRRAPWLSKRQGCQRVIFQHFVLAQLQAPLTLSLVNP